MLQYVWLAVLIVLIIAEAATVGLVSIWFAGGALAAMFLAMAEVSPVWQLVVFLVVSFGLLLVTRPIAMRHFNNKKEKTNYQSIIGTVIRITETVDNFHQTGAAFADGKEWTVRSADGEIVIEKDSPAVVVAVEGVKLLVRPIEEGKKERESREEIC